MSHHTAQYPIDADAYGLRFHRNTKVTGHGLGNMFTHYPCPFCAAPEFCVAEVLETERVLSQPHTCAECGRTAQCIFTRTDVLGEVHMEMIQTGGEDPDPWLTPAPRRVS